jgi:hypothetical protein
MMLALKIRTVASSVPILKWKTRRSPARRWWLRAKAF